MINMDEKIVNKILTGCIQDHQRDHHHHEQAGFMSEVQE